MLAEQHRDPSAFDRAKGLAAARSAARLLELGVDALQARQFQVLANRVLYSDASLRAAPAILGRNMLGPAALWPHGISGDLPIVLARIDAETGLDLVKQVLLAQTYWHAKLLAVDIVLLNEGSADSAERVQSAITAATSAAQSSGVTGRGRVFSLRGDRVDGSSLELLQTAARAVLDSRLGTLDQQLACLRDPEPPQRSKGQDSAPPPSAGTSRPAPNLEYFNGLGGFAASGREYVTLVDEGHRTPAPWVNIVTNPHFGFQVSADGTGSTWSLNSREYQLTPWSNDPVSDTPAEVIYLRDDRTGAVWSATPLPIRQPAYSYTVRHGFGYTRFVNTSHGIALDLLQFVPLDDAVKISRLKLANRSQDTRVLSVANYLDWVLGNQRSRTAPFIVTKIEPRTSALIARNPWRTEFQTRVAFLDLCGRQTSCTGDRAEFIGRHGSLAEPAALRSTGALSNRVGGGLDSCGALQTQVTLRPGEETELVFLLGDAESEDAAVALIERYRRSDLEVVLKSVTDYWDQTLGAIQVKTPDRTMDILVNGWLLYQTLACRMWSRTGFYQASGAYGFRDQLQDSMALCVSRPALVREHILRAAARQFMAGDVQHWWLPTSGQGVKTRISDNRIWLPFVVAHYLEVTEDFGILDEQVHFLDGPPLTPDQQEVFESPPITANTASLFEHCVLALNCSLAIGSHGLPLFGAGDWNDGMNRVGAAGRGESVWLGWFLYSTLLKFADVADRHGDGATAESWRKHAFTVQQAIEREAWDGDWYRRGYFDDGSPLGSISNDECRIDAIAQSWAVISGAGEPQRSARAMAAVEAQLISRSDGLVKLFTPPFNRTAHDPGYIKAYPPGLRENGGQYTHAAMWTTLAFAVMGDGDRAGEILSLLNPINHAATRAGIYRYKVEPYVVCADVYSSESHVGRGGWTWYTGSAGWMYRTATEGILGIHLRGNILSIDPCIPRTWPGFEITYKRGASRYHIAVENPNGVCRGVVHCSLDGKELSRKQCDIGLVDDGTYHHVRVRLG
jgi:cyclic beta-1,2-glucan synthetase